MDVCIYVRYMHAFTYMCMYFKIILMPGFACRLQFLFVCLNVNTSLYFIFLGPCIILYDVGGTVRPHSTLILYMNI